MSKPRLGVVFDGAIFSQALAGESFPDLALPPLPGVIAELLRALPHYDIFVYPRLPAAGRGAAIKGYLHTSLQRHFERRELDLIDPEAHADVAIASLRACERRPQRIDREVSDAAGWPTETDLRALWADEPA